MKKPDSTLKINDRLIGTDYPTYFVADIAANHDGDLARAVDLIHQAAAAGADAAKFQHFKAETIVSDHGFRSLGNQQSHQSKWKSSVFEIYEKASVSMDWTPKLVEACDKAGIAFFTSPYAIDIVNQIDPFIPAYKIGSGDITWIEMIEHVANKNKPYLIASGASSFSDVQRAVTAGLEINLKLCLMQCNTNYTASLENFKYIQLNVLKAYRAMYPDMVLGLSDHTPGHATVLGAVALGARIIEKHFTDDVNREGPDHAFSMNPGSWKDMVYRTRELENALGAGSKCIEENERQTVILQRRSIRVNADIKSGSILQRENLTVLRPCPIDALPPFNLDACVGKRVRHNLTNGDYIKWIDLE